MAPYAAAPTILTACRTTAPAQHSLPCGAVASSATYSGQGWCRRCCCRCCLAGCFATQCSIQSARACTLVWQHLQTAMKPCAESQQDTQTSTCDWGITLTCTQLVPLAAKNTCKCSSAQQQVNGMHTAASRQSVS